MNLIFRFLDALGVPRVFDLVWSLLTRVDPLTEAEVTAASSVLGPDAIDFGAVRVADGRILSLIFKINGGRAFTTFRTINIRTTGPKSRERVDIMVHELVHVYQFERVGSVYIPKALWAQWTSGYRYGGTPQLIRDRQEGKRFRDYNFEQQGQIAQDYYREVVARGLADSHPSRGAYEPFIEELRRGEF